MFQLLRTNKPICVLLYTLLFAELLVPHNHLIGESQTLSLHQENIPHVETTQAKTIFHTVAQLYRDHASFELLPVQTDSFSFDFYAVVSELYVVVGSTPEGRGFLQFHSLRAPPRVSC